MVNAQYPITTAPKYNFPLPKEDLQIPQHFIELSIRSLKKPQQLQRSFATNPDTPFFALEYPEQLPTTTRLVRLGPNPIRTPIVAVDVSSIKLGETDSGILLAVRGAIVWKKTRGYRYVRLGPFPFHITRKSKDEIWSRLQNHETTYKQGQHSPSSLYMQTKLTTLLERWIQRSVNQATHGGIILWDGSLTAGTPETPVHIMKRMLEEAVTRQNTILAFSKMTRLFLNGSRLTDLIWKHPPPCLLQIQNYPTRLGPMRLMGNIYVAKLTRGSCAFRLDIDRQLPCVEAVEAVQKLLGNELIVQSYPETLRLAHIFSTFTATEVLGMQRCLSQESKIRVLARPNVRRILFGRFGKGPEG